LVKIANIIEKARALRKASFNSLISEGLIPPTPPPRKGELLSLKKFVS